MPSEAAAGRQCYFLNLLPMIPPIAASAATLPACFAPLVSCSACSSPNSSARSIAPSTFAITGATTAFAVSVKLPPLAADTAPATTAAGVSAKTGTEPAAPTAFPNTRPHRDFAIMPSFVSNLRSVRSRATYRTQYHPGRLARLVDNLYPLGGTLWARRRTIDVGRPSLTGARPEAGRPAGASRKPPPSGGRSTA